MSNLFLSFKLWSFYDFFIWITCVLAAEKIQTLQELKFKEKNLRVCLKRIPSRCNRLLIIEVSFRLYFEFLPNFLIFRGNNYSRPIQPSWQVRRVLQSFSHIIFFVVVANFCKLLIKTMNWNIYLFFYACACYNTFSRQWLHIAF